MPELLALDQVTAGYGRSVVLESISFHLDPGESLALLGRNGVGKTTLLATLMGQTRLHSGQMRWKGDRLDMMKPHSRARVGLGWVPQERWIFKSLTVEENLTAASRAGPWSLDRVYGLMPRLRERRSNMGNQLSGGEQQMLALGRALMLNPSLLLLDEPMEGLAPLIVEELSRTVKALIATGDMAVIVVEQHARLALSMVSRALVLDRGCVVHQSDSQSLMNDAVRLDALLAV
jgi:branched-chain amino acid transport system ATP-binding protein